MNVLIFRPVLIAALLTSVCACSTPRVEGSARLTVLQDTVLPAPARTDQVAPDRSSLIGPLDTISIEVFGVSDLTREVKVDASGRIAYPVIGELEVAGRTSAELAEIIRLKLAQYVRSPQVIVNLRESVSQVVTVDGEVKKPGLYPVTNQTTLLRAVAAAEGASEFAKLEDVVVLRQVNGKQYAGLYNLGAIRRGVYDDPYIFANDVVVVGNSPARRLFRDLLAIGPLLVTPAVALIQR